MEIPSQTTCLDPYFASFEESLSSRNYKPETLANYRCLLRRFGRLLETEGIAPSALTPDLAVALGRRLPITPKSQINNYGDSAQNFRSCRARGYPQRSQFCALSP